MSAETAVKVVSTDLKILQIRLDCGLWLGNLLEIISADVIWIKSNVDICIAPYYSKHHC